MQRRLLILLALLLAGGAYFVFDVGRRARVDRGARFHRTDFTVYQAAARALVDGGDPYEARNIRGYRYVYPPLLAVALMPVARWDPPHAALVFYVLSMLAYLGALVGLARLRVDGAALGWRAAAVGAVVCLGFAHQGFQRGQVTHLLLGLHVAALVALLGRRHLLAGFCLALGGALRLTPLLAAGAVGLGLLVALVRSGERAPFLRFAGGVAGGLVLAVVVLPVLALGPQRALAVHEQWAKATRAVYAENVDLEADYKINEWRFKNQAPRRVYGTWIGWTAGLDFEGERPLLAEGGPARSAWEGLSNATTWLLLLVALCLGAGFLRDPGDSRFAAAFAGVTLLPVLMTRYTWPTHYLLALPAVAWAWARGGRAGRAGVVVLLGGAALFYAAHAAPLQVVGEAGCLLLACAAFLLLAARAGLRGRRP